jgi:hypothetical protein
MAASARPWQKSLRVIRKPKTACAAGIDDVRQEERDSFDSVMENLPERTCFHQISRSRIVE